MVWSLALCPDDGKQDPVVYGVYNVCTGGRMYGHHV